MDCTKHEFKYVNISPSFKEERGIIVRVGCENCDFTADVTNQLTEEDKKWCTEVVERMGAKPEGILNEE